MPAIYWFPLFPKKQIHSVSHRQTGPGQHKAFTRTWSRRQWAPGHPAARTPPHSRPCPPSRPPLSQAPKWTRWPVSASSPSGEAWGLHCWSGPHRTGPVARDGLRLGSGQGRGEPEAPCFRPWPQVGESHPGCLPRWQGQRGLKTQRWPVTREARHPCSPPLGRVSSAPLGSASSKVTGMGQRPGDRPSRLA